MIVWVKLLMKCCSSGALEFLLLRKYVFEESLRMKSGPASEQQDTLVVVVGSAVFFHIFSSRRPS
jgi:hypothetical protein